MSWLHTPERVPRTRGDGPSWGWWWSWGWGVFPAHAGMDRSPATALAGDTPCSPHTRGWTAYAVPPVRAQQIVFPAHAGMDRNSSCHGST